MPPFFTAPRARLAWRLSGFATNSREHCRLVFSANVGARRLWDKLGFNVLGVIPGAVQKNDGTYRDSMIMCRSLLD
jgi:L-amino acid N-acyltransferase YncA